MSNEFKPKRAQKSQVKLKMALQGPSGSGKTEGALALATNLLYAMGHQPGTLEGKILLVDTENESASLYAAPEGRSENLDKCQYVFDTIPLCAPYTPERYKMAYQQAIDGGYLILIGDSITHEWDGDGGILRQKDRLDLKENSNSFTNWAALSPKHEAFVEFIKQIPVHTITTMRTKQAYVLKVNSKGKQVPEKLGMAPIQREGAEYEYTIVFDITMGHKAKTSKNRTTLFKNANGEDDGSVLDLRDPGIAGSIHDWLTSGAVLVDKPWTAPKETEPKVGEAPNPPKASLATVPNCMDVKDCQKFWIEARKNGKTEDMVRQWTVATYKVESVRHIPAEHTDAAIKWAKDATIPRQYAPGEEECRKIAKLLGVSESDLVYCVATNRNNWVAAQADLSAAEDARVAATEAAAR